MSMFLKSQKIITAVTSQRRNEIKNGQLEIDSLTVSQPFLLSDNTF